MEKCILSLENLKLNDLLIDNIVIKEEVFCCGKLYIQSKYYSSITIENEYFVLVNLSDTFNIPRSSVIMTEWYPCNMDYITYFIRCKLNTIDSNLQLNKINYTIKLCIHKNDFSKLLKLIQKN